MYDRVLVATDGGDQSAVALEHALTIAADHGATAYALYVVDRRIYSTAFDDGPSNRKEELREAGDRAIADAERRATEHDVEFVGEIRDGDPETVLPKYADEIDADLIVVGSHGKSSREKVQGLGSVSEATVKATGRSVLVVGPDAEA